ncbi:hypothetical protein TBR22_A22590 [Luteitalea sp. TBR-22]|uniref:tetratricopeptide repeat protein n=1 Tax=Luteitalea sp. TBR-22 TaxID=2802971 RepID=UPI001AF350CD|nr:hypothetical protein [Luteitalea sp. TBR-22]BCS33034.1 hypothetical protein TBR22_A22590 [Luteitalea sp. TBR-22]
MRAPASWLGIVVLALVVAACGPARAPVVAPDQWPAQVAAADVRAAEGCYRCLADALQSYEQALAVRTDAVLGGRAYRAAVHLALRERVIGLYPGAYRDAPERLRAVATADDASAATDVLEAVPWRRGTLVAGTGQFPGQATLAAWRSRRKALEVIADADPWAATLLIALAGTNPIVTADEGQPPTRGTPPLLAPERWATRHADDASFTFTRLLLLRSSLEEVTAFHAAHPTFDEVDVLVGEAELGRGRLVSAEEAFARALAAMPDLVPARALTGDVRQRMEDFEVSLAAYDTLLARVPDHREALLGRMKSLGWLGRHEEAVTAADRMITLGTWYVGEAQYWKAWNLYNLKRLDGARAAVDAARSLMVNADLSYLGGAIAFQQQRQDDALKDFDAAIALESRLCEAHFDRAAVYLIRRDWAVSAPGFDEAFECLAARTPTFEQRIADAREARLEATARAALVARREKALVEHRHQKGWARYNAAVAHANAGHADLVQPRIDEALALGGPAADAARDLQAQLKGR